LENTPLIEMKNITKYFGGVRALHNVDFELYPNEIVGLVGGNGAGKSTLIKILSGAFIPDSGRIYCDGKEVHLRSPRAARELGIETVYQDLALTENLNVPANIFLSRELVRGFLGNIIKILDEKKMEEETRKLMHGLRIHIDSLDTVVRNLSGGQRQAVALARALYFNTKVVVMDEPTAALGVEETRKTINLILEFKRKGISTIVISHELRDIFDITDRIVVLKNGERMGMRITKETNEDEIVRMVMMGKEAVNS